MKIFINAIKVFLSLFLIIVCVCVETAICQVPAGQQGRTNENRYNRNIPSQLVSEEQTLGNAPHRMPMAPGDEKWDDRFCDIGTNYTVWALAVLGNDVYIGGEYTTIGGATINHIAKWDGRSYSSLGDGLTVSYPFTTIGVTPINMIAHGTDLYVCGNFRVAGTDTVNGIAKWNGSSWSALGTGADNIVNTIAIDGNYLYAGGHFRTIGGVPANRIARYNLTTGIWDSLGSGVGDDIHGEVREIVVHNGIIYAGGVFFNAGGVTVNHIVVWDGTHWQPMNGGVMNSTAPSINTMVFIGDDLYIGGEFGWVGDFVMVHNLARWDGTNWNPVGTGTDWMISDFLYDSTYLYLAGAFNTVNGTSVAHVARLDPLTYSVTSLGAGLYSDYPTSGTAVQMTKKGTDIFAGGLFFGTDSVNMYNIARWNTTEGRWHAVGKGLNSNVYSISVRPGHPDDVFVGGQFSSRYAKFSNKVTKFSGGEWNPLDSGIMYFCYATASTVSDFYAAGQIVNASGLPVNNIAKWDIEAGTWSALGSGLTGGFAVNAVAIRGTELFAGGDFTTAGGTPASRIARWDGTSWSALGAGVNGEVRAIAVTDSFVYVGGYFTEAGGIPANYVARWDGTNWTTLGSGPNNGTDYRVYALAVSGNDVYAGGTFENAGGVSALNIAKWNSTSNTWSALGTGVSWYGGGIVNAIAANNKNIYVGGMLATAGGVSVSNIALWNDSTSSWSSLGSGVDNEVKALTVSNTGKLYVGGIFLNAGVKPSRYFAIWDGSPATTPLPPVPVSPANDSSCIALNPTLQWSTSEGATSYRIQVSTDSLFGTTFLDSSGITSTSIVVAGLAPSTKYFWRANATNTAGTSAWSTVVHFTTGAGTLLAPSQVSPLNGATGIPSSTTLYWERACGAQSYILQIAYDTNFTSMFFSGGGITGTSYGLFELPAATWHYWRLRSVNGGDTSAWSSTWKFRTWGGEPSSPSLAGPANDTTCIPLTPTLQWNAVSGATSYRIQVSTDSLFVVTVFDSSNHTGTSITVPALLPLTKYYWRVNAANSYGTSGWSSRRSFTTRTGALSAPTLTSPANGAYNIPTVTTLTWERPCGAQSFFLQIAYDSGFTSFVYNNGGIAQSFYNLFELPTATWHYWRLRSISGADTSAWSSAWKFMTAGGSISLSVEYDDRWNLLSVPLTVSDFRRVALFSASTSQAFFYNGSAYVSAETLANRKGYWLKFGSAGNANIYGTVRITDTAAVIPGWNLIGSISQAVPVKDILSIPPEMFVSNFYGYDRGYFIVDTIKPGKGYWVNVSGSGSLILSSTTLESKQRIKIIPSSLMPPPPPEQHSMNLTPETFSLGQNYPNPFNPTTVFSFRLPVSCYVTLKVYNVLGEEVATVVDAFQTSGFKSQVWEASGLPSGIYYYRLTAVGQDGILSYTDVKKIILMK